MSIVDALHRARAAFERRDWLAAYGELSAADPAQLSSADFKLLADAAYLRGRHNDCVQAMQRAYTHASASGEEAAALRYAAQLATILLTHGETAVGSGWVGRAERLAARVGSDAPERGYLSIASMFRALAVGDMASVARYAAEIAPAGLRHGDADLTAIGLSSSGRMAIKAGRVAEAFEYFDEAMVTIVTGEVSAMFTGIVYCSMIEACQEVADFGRAAEWTLALTDWADEQPELVAFTGQCAIHRGQIMALRGAFADALVEFAAAAERYLRAGHERAAGQAYAERGDVLRILGRYADAAVDYQRAAQHGHEPQPGLALLWLAEGKAEAAAGALRRLLAETQPPASRAAILPAAVDVCVAVAEIADAAAAATDLADLARRFPTGGLAARAAQAAAVAACGTREFAVALAAGKDAVRRWEAIGSPYEAARARTLVGIALRALGDGASGAAESAAAAAVFAGLGVPLYRPAGLEPVRPSFPDGLTAREAEVLRLVAHGNSNAEIARRLVLSERTVAHHVSNIFTKIDVGSRTAAAAYAYAKELA